MTKKECSAEMKGKVNNFLDGFIEEFDMTNMFIAGKCTEGTIFCARGGADPDHLMTSLYVLLHLVNDSKCDTPEILSLIDQLGELIILSFKEQIKQYEKRFNIVLFKERKK